MKTYNEAHAEHTAEEERLWKLYCREEIDYWQYRRLVDASFSKSVVIMNFWNGTPTQQLCAVAQMLETGEQP